MSIGFIDSKPRGLDRHDLTERRTRPVEGDLFTGLARPLPFESERFHLVVHRPSEGHDLAWIDLQPQSVMELHTRSSGVVGPERVVSRQVLSTEGWAGLEAQLGRQVAIAPDGSSMILPVGSVETGFQLALKLTGSTEITPIPGMEGTSDVVYSPDSQWIAYGIGSDLFKRPLVGSSPLRLAEDTQSTSEATAALDWLDDGTILWE